MSGFWERAYPLIISSFIVLLLIIAHLFFKWDTPCLNTNFDKILDSTITFSSIVEGFIGVLLGIFITIKETKTVKIIFRYIDKKQMMYYLKEALFFGFLAIISSASLYIDNKYSDYIFYIWIFSLAYFLFASFRITMIMFQIIETDEEEIIDSAGGFTSSPEEIEEAKKRLSN